VPLENAPDPGGPHSASASTMLTRTATPCVTVTLVRENVERVSAVISRAAAIAVAADPRRTGSS